MKRKLLLTVAAISVFCLWGQGQGQGQEEETTSEIYTLLTMPYINRPLLMYKGQLQVNVAYDFSVRSRSFDDNGEVINLKQQGNSSVGHSYCLEAKYGLTGFLEAGAAASYMKKGIRSESVTYLSWNDIIETNELNEYRGMTDIRLHLAVRLPVQFKWFDFALGGGISLPTAGYEPDKPSHSISDITGLNSYTVNYNYNNRNGLGVPVYFISAATKLTVQKFALEADFTFSDPLEEGTNIRWEETMTDYTFTYFSESYKYLINRSMLINAAVHYQPVGWFNIYVNGKYFSSSGGWTEYWGNKYRNYEVSLLTIEPGYEIQISPLVSIYQVVGFSLAGRNTDAPFYLFTTLRFNLFPFYKK